MIIDQLDNKITEIFQKSQQVKLDNKDLNNHFDEQATI